MANSNENSLNAHLHNPDFNPTYIYVGDERTPEPSLWNFGKIPQYCNPDSTIEVLRNSCHSI